MIGHEWAVNLLAEHVAQGRERHAYLLTGPRGVGRRTLALRFAQSLNCKTPPSPGQPCRVCSSCRHIEQMQHPDLSVVQAEREGAVLKIDQVRELQHILSLAPFEARYRVALLLRFEEAHANAANAMLKTLEEPPARVVLLLTASSSESLLPTIVSRCEVLRLRPISIEETAQGLRLNRDMPLELSEQLAHISNGRPGYAIRLFEQPKLLEARSSTLDGLIQLLASTRRERFAFAKTASEDKEELREMLQVWLTFWRDVLISASGINHAITNLDYSVQVQHIAEMTGMSTARDNVVAVERTLDQIDRNVNSLLALEVLLMDFPKITSQ